MNTPESLIQLLDKHIAMPVDDDHQRGWRRACEFIKDKIISGQLSSEIRDNTADVMYDQLLWQLIRYANICPDDKGKYSVSAAFSYIHKNSWRYAAERFIHDALHLIELYRAKASESKPVTWTNDDRAVMEKENALLKERLMKCNEVIMRHTARDLQNPLEPVSVSLEKCAKLYCDSYYEYSILDRGGYSRQEFIDKFWDRWKPLVKHFLDAAGVKYVD